MSILPRFRRASSSSAAPKQPALGRIRRTFLSQARELHPLWFNSRVNGHGMPEREWERVLADVRDTLESRGADTARVLEVIAHLMEKWPDALHSYNAYYVLENAREMRLLDEQYMPAPTSPTVNEENRRTREIIDAGGFTALATYHSIVGPPRRRRR